MKTRTNRKHRKRLLFDYVTGTVTVFCLFFRLPNNEEHRYISMYRINRFNYYSVHSKSAASKSVPIKCRKKKKLRFISGHPVHLNSRLLIFYYVGADNPTGLTAITAYHKRIVTTIVPRVFYKNILFFFRFFSFFFPDRLRARRKIFILVENRLARRTRVSRTAAATTYDFI